MSETQDEHGSTHATHRGHEPITVSSRAIALWGAGLVVLVAFALGVVFALQSAFMTAERERAPRRSPLAERRAVRPPQPVSIDQPEQLLRLRQAEEERLTTYGRKERDAGTARIPVERAMEILSERGLSDNE